MKTKKLLSYLLALAAIFSASAVSAADVTPQSAEVNQSEAMSLVSTMEIGRVIFSPETRKLSIEVFFTNPKDSFLDNFGYNVFLFKGEKYSISGDQFEGLEYVLGKSGVFAPAEPNEKARQTIEIDIPESVPSGNYFIKISADDRYSEVIGIAASKGGTSITGKGTYMGFPPLFVSYNGEAIELLTGAAMKPEESLVVGIDLTKSLKYRDFVADGGKILTEAEVLGLDGHTIYRYGGTIEFVPTAADKNILVAQFAPFEGISAGPHSLRLNIVDDKGVALLLEPVTVRWLVDGFSSKITRFNSFSNVYTEGSSLDMDGVIASVNAPESKAVNLSVEVTTTDGEVIPFLRTIELNGQEFTDFDLSDESFPIDATVTKVVATLTDADTGQVFDTYTINTNVGAFEAPKGVSDQKTILLLSAAVFLLLLIFYFVVRAFRSKDKAVPPAIAALFLLLLGGAVFASFSGDDVLAKRNTTMKNSTATVWLGNSPSGNIGVCPQTVNVTTYAHASCPHCMNGNRIAAQTFGTYANGTSAQSPVFYGWFPGGMGNNFAGGPFNYAFPTQLTASNNSLTYFSRAMVERHINHGYCLASGWVQSESRTVSCSVTPTITDGGGGGCGAGQYYCEVNGRCVANSDTSSCNRVGEYEPFEINQNIPAVAGPVKLRGNLNGKPPIVNKGATCVVDWSSEFVSYDKLTVCRFTAPGVSIDFAPGDTSAPTSASILNIQNDTAYKMVCSESDGLTPPEESEGVCRLNWDYVEVN
jgi:hypothetical protein